MFGRKSYICCECKALRDTKKYYHYFASLKVANTELLVRGFAGQQKVLFAVER